MSELPEIVRLLFALTFVIGLMGGLALVLKKLGLAGALGNTNTLSKEKRLKIVEALPLDTRRRLVIVSCDGKEHLVLLGANTDTVIDTDLKTSKAKNA